MSLTDPIANYLTCLRNALQAKRQKVDIPSSNLLVEMTKLLKEEGYINNYKVTRRRQQDDSARLFEVRKQRRTRDFRAAAHFAARLSNLYFLQVDSASAGRFGNQHFDDSQRRAFRSRGKETGRRRRSSLQCVVGATASLRDVKPHVKNRKQSDPSSVRRQDQHWCWSG